MVSADKLAPALAVLRRVQEVCPRAIIAGGFLRDLIAGVEPKDIDIFVPFTEYRDNQGLLNMGAVQDPMSGYVGIGEDQEVFSVMNLPAAEVAYPVQIIELRAGLDPVERAKAHDFGTCQVWHDGGQLHFTGLFTDDLDRRTFTLTDSGSSAEYERSLRRWERISKKFPGWVLIDLNMEFV